jgi:hypothetical protein
MAKSTEASQSKISADHSKEKEDTDDKDRLLIVAPHGSLGNQLACIAAAFEYGTQTGRQVLFVPDLPTKENASTHHYWSTLFVNLPQILDPEAFAPLIAFFSRRNDKDVKENVIGLTTWKEVDQKQKERKEKCVIWDHVDVPLSSLEKKLESQVWTKCFPDSYWAYALQIAQQTKWNLLWQPDGKKTKHVVIHLSECSTKTASEIKEKTKSFGIFVVSAPWAYASELKNLLHREEDKTQLLVLESYKWPDFINLLLLGIMFWLSGGGIVCSRSKFGRCAMWAADYLQHYSSQLIQSPLGEAITSPHKSLTWTKFD